MNNLEKIRKENNLNQGEMGAIIGMSRGQYRRAEIGETDLKGENIKKLSKRFNKSADYILGIEENNKIDLRKITLDKREIIEKLSLLKEREQIRLNAYIDHIIENRLGNIERRQTNYND